MCVRVMGAARSWEQVDVVSVHGGAALVAAEICCADLSACPMAVEHRGACGSGEPSVSPPDHDDEKVDKLNALCGQVVLVSRSSVVGAAFEHAVIDEVAEALGQHLARDAEVGLDLVEAVHADPDVAQYQWRPWLADHVHCARD